MTPETTSPQETIEEIAERITSEWLDQEDWTAGALSESIVTALRSRDERAAKIAESMRPAGGRMWTDEQSACFDALTDCAAAIRQGK